MVFVARAVFSRRLTERRPAWCFSNKVFFVKTHFRHQGHGKPAAEVAAFGACSDMCREKVQGDVHQQETPSASMAPTRAAVEKPSAQVESAGAGILAKQAVLHQRTLRGPQQPTAKL